MKIMKKLSVFLFALLFAWSAAATGIVDLKVEYTATPIGIDVERPRFSWKMFAPEQKGRRQSAYALTVKDQDGTLVWQTGKVSSAQSLKIDYAGKPLAAARSYDWSVEVWD